MALELHVWGPAFGLDSIDPECLAAIACFRCALSSENWTLIASNDASLSPDNVLPALYHKGTWTSGYANIVGYLKQHAGGETNLLIDHDLTPQQRADLVAYSSYLTARGSGLLALSLYASPKAWVEITRPAYATVLPFPLTWTVPTAIRAAAVEKAEHLGMGYLAAEVDAEESSSQGAAETTSTGFLRLRQTLGPSKTFQPEQTAAIRFQYLADDFYSTLDQLRGEGQGKFLLRDGEPTSLDFLAYGYLSLMRVQTPHPILKTVLEKKYGRLVDFLGAVDAYKTGYTLPWQQAQPRGALGLLGSFSDGVMENVPSVGNSWKRWRRGGIRTEAGEDVKDLTQLGLVVGGAFVGLAALGATALFRGLTPFGESTHRFEPTKEDKPNLHQFGEIGAMLNALPVWDPPQASPPVGDTVYHKGDVDVSVDVAPVPAPGSLPA
ncbi:Uu.00g027320.m01.CDS01 [Anthostomella pinea]|uniref:Uu.00g027320.m01.CDS01 n=1 Tax=Anthostomella pinea TaxID=933095 RepID=A0AAI8V7P0_9PEZI|nr:Uu.00g027320.m01.CDS01 [Anthostomella pinea]